MLRWTVKIVAFTVLTLIGILTFGAEMFLPYGGLLAAGIVEGVEWIERHVRSAS